METAVEKLEAMFLKSKADLEYIEKRLKLDFINNIAENGSPEAENPAAILGELRAIKAKHANLFLEMEEIAAAQKQSMNSLRSSMNAVTELTRHLQHTRDLQVGSVDVSDQQQTIGCEIKQLSDTVFKGVPLSMRSKVKLPELNLFYQQLQEHLCKNNSNSCLSVQKMKQLKINASEAMLKVLQHLALIEVDKKGSVRLFNCN